MNPSFLQEDIDETYGPSEEGLMDEDGTLVSDGIENVDGYCPKWDD